LFDNGDVWTAYQVLQNTRDVAYFSVYYELKGAYCGGDVEGTAEIVQSRYERMVAERQEAYDRRLADDAAREMLLSFIKRWRRILTLGLWT
jgi:RNA polymerase-interacting CarD/CdnL/TRCF family regulator